MSSKGSFHLYVTTEERAALHQCAEAIGTTDAYVARLFIRHFFHLPVGDKGNAELIYLSGLGLTTLKVI